MSKIGRNDPCPCESGLKYKVCHGDELKTAIAKRIANQAMLLMIAETRYRKDIITREGLNYLYDSFDSMVLDFCRPFVLARYQDSIIQPEIKVENKT